jgi:hypothetical protein
VRRLRVSKVTGVLSHKDTELGHVLEHEKIPKRYLPHQVDNAARQRSRGLGLGLSIVKSLGELLGHPINVRWLHGKGSVFSIEVPLTPNGAPSAPRDRSPLTDDAPAQTARRTGAILVIEDDPEVREHLKLFLRAHERDHGRAHCTYNDEQAGAGKRAGAGRAKGRAARAWAALRDASRAGRGRARIGRNILAEESEAV